MTKSAAERLAIDGGEPVRRELLPYGRHAIDDDDVAAVTAVLRSSFLTTGPHVAALEEAFAARVGTREAVAVSSGTAALHAAAHGLGVGPGDEVIVPTLTFVATASSMVMAGGTPVFADVDPDTLLLDPESVAARITPRTAAVVAVDFAGQPCDYVALAEVCEGRAIPLLADGCHALGAAERGKPVGSLARATTFSLHPVKHVAAGEGGVLTTDDAELAARARRFRNHGMTRDYSERAARDDWHYDVVELGYNYRLTDLQCALAQSQLAKLAASLERRRAIAARYDRAFAEVDAVTPLATRDGVEHAYHLYVVRLDEGAVAGGRGAVFRALRAEGIGVNVHYPPAHLHRFYRERFGTGPGQCPVAEAAYAQMLTLPLFPGMSDDDVDDVITAVDKVLRLAR